MDIKEFFQEVELFNGLSSTELDQIIAICHERVYSKGENLTIEGEYGDEMYVITEGYVEVMLSAKSDLPARVVVNLGAGQITGEMALIDQGPRSATVRAITSPTVVQVINRVDFDNLCQVNTQIGYTVMRNMAGDLVFKLRHRNLAER